MKNAEKLIKRKTSRELTAMVIILIIFASSSSYGATWNYYLQASVTSVPAGTYNASPAIPNENILMWGYQICDSAFVTCGSPKAGAGMPPTAANINTGSATFPGPVLFAREGDTLIIHLRDNLTTAAATAAGFPVMMTTEPTSLIIPGQSTTLTPTWITVDANGGFVSIASTGARAAGDVTARVRSFTTETPANGTTVTSYTWTNLKPGIYLYESGTHPAVQVQMGLYGALKVYPLTTTFTPGLVPPASGRAYDDASTAYNSEVILLYSEIDQELHYSIASGLYGTPLPAPPTLPTRGQRTSTIEFAPKFFLINGQPVLSAITPATISAIAIPAGRITQKTLIRFLNAGLKEKTPTLLNQYMNLIAEDGNPYTYVQNGSQHYFSKQQYSLLLPAGKTMDAIMSPAAAQANTNMPVFDRSLNLTNSNMSPGGMLGYLHIAP